MLFCNEGYGRTCLYMFFLSDLQYHIYSVIYPHLLLKYVSACTPFFANYVLSLQAFAASNSWHLSFYVYISSFQHNIHCWLHLNIPPYIQTNRHTHTWMHNATILLETLLENYSSCELISTFLDHLNPNTNHPNHHLCLFRLIFFFQTQHIYMYQLQIIFKHY